MDKEGRRDTTNGEEDGDTIRGVRCTREGKKESAQGERKRRTYVRAVSRGSR